MSSDLRTKLTLLKWMGICSCFAAVVTNLVLFATQGTDWLTGADDQVPAEEQTATLEATPYLAEIGAALRQDPVWVDPLVGGTLGTAWIDDTVRGEIEASSTPVFVVVSASSQQDGNGGDEDLILERLREATGRSGVYFLIDPRTMTYTNTVGDKRLYLEHGFIAVPSPSDLAKAVSEVDGAMAEATDGKSSTADRISRGIAYGLPYLVVSWFVARWLARAGRRDTTYLQGFSA